jgi:hypothetical protein
MCQTKRPTITAAAPAEKPAAQFTTPDQLASRGMASDMQASMAGRNALRIDRGSDPTMAGVAPTENDQVRDYPAEEAAAAAAAANAAAAAAAAAKRKKKKLFGKIQRVFDPGGSIIATVKAIT